LVMAWEMREWGKEFLISEVMKMNNEGLFCMLIDGLEVGGNMTHWVHEVEACGCKKKMSHSKKERESTWEGDRIGGGGFEFLVVIKSFRNNSVTPWLHDL
jgi:hypothetical protein